jgi:CBS-domain-containing membrane protein
MSNAVCLATVPLSRYSVIETQGHPLDLPVNAEARDVLFDFSLQPPLIVPATTSLEAARRWIRQARARILIVVDAREAFTGIVSAADLFSGRSLLNPAHNGSRATVADMLTPKAQLAGIPLAALATATMADLARTLESTGHAHLLVVDVERHTICGLVCRADVMQRLHASATPASRGAALAS